MRHIVRALAAALLPLAAAAQDSWTPTSTTSAPQGRVWHTLVWTGRLAIVWGGVPLTNTGGIYDPVTDAWQATNTLDAPTERSQHVAVWTTTRMIVWGGEDSAGPTDTGGRYDPALDAWTALPLAGAPSARRFHVAVWTGNEMIVWGGLGETYLNSGGRYNPLANAWTPTSLAGAPAGRRDATAVWTDTSMIVWGGLPHTNTGGAYNPASDNWTATSVAGAPSARTEHTAVWTGRQMVVWGGWDAAGTPLGTGGRYDPAAGSWLPMNLAGAPTSRLWHSAVANGADMIVWGGWDGTSFLATGGRYDPASDTWIDTTTGGAPSARAQHEAAWTGDEMIVWGGIGAGGALLDTGARYSPRHNTWSPTTTTNAPSPRGLHTAVWTGREMVVWGGWNGAALADGGRYGAGPALGVAPKLVELTATMGDADPAAIAVTVQNVGAPDSTLSYTATSSAAWVAVAPPSGSLLVGQADLLSITVTLGGLPAGTHTGTVTIADPKASNSPQAVTVKLTLNPGVPVPPKIGVGPGTLAFVVNEGGANPADQTLTVTNSGAAGSALNFTVSHDAAWLSVTPATGLLASGASAALAVWANPAGLVPGAYSASITVWAPAATNHPQTVAVTLTILARPQIVLTPAALGFKAVEGGATPAAQSVTVLNPVNPGQDLVFAATADAAWLSVSPASGTVVAAGYAALTVTVQPAGLAAGSYAATVVVSDPNAKNDPQAVAVTLEVSTAPAAEGGGHSGGCGARSPRGAPGAILALGWVALLAASRIRR